MTIKTNSRYSNILFLLFWTSSLYVYSLIYLLNDFNINEVVLVSGLIAFLLSFLVLQRVTLGVVLTLFLFIKISFLYFTLIDTSFMQYIMDNGDANNYHIPMILSLNIDNFINYLSDYKEYAMSTGRFTHVIDAGFYYLFSSFSSNNEYEMVMISTYILNTILLTLSSVLLYFSLRKEKIAREFAVLSVSLILFSPFVLTWSAYTLKETIHICMVSFVVIAIMKKNYILLLFISLFFFIDRMYMVYLPFVIFILSNNINKKTIILLSSFLLLIVMSFFPIQSYIDMLVYMLKYQNSKVESGNSLVSSTNLFFNLIRVFLSPFPFSAFKYPENGLNVFYREHFLVNLLYVYFMFKIFLTRKNNFKYLLILILLINLILFPLAARQKITVLIPLISIIYAIYCNDKKYGTKYLNSLWKI